MFVLSAQRAIHKLFLPPQNLPVIRLREDAVDNNGVEGKRWHDPGASLALLDVSVCNPVTLLPVFRVVFEL